jgi:hypothetical protein
METSTLTTVQEIVTAVTAGSRAIRPGLLVTKELDKALENCRVKVKSIAEDCRQKNKKFR